MTQAAADADRAGFDAVWTSELYNRSATITVASLALATTSCAVGTGHPLRRRAQPADARRRGARPRRALARALRARHRERHPPDDLRLARPRRRGAGDADGGARPADAADLEPATRRRSSTTGASTTCTSRRSTTWPPSRSATSRSTPPAVNPRMIETAGRVADGLLGPHAVQPALHPRGRAARARARRGARGPRPAATSSSRPTRSARAREDEELARRDAAAMIAFYGSVKSYGGLFDSLRLRRGGRARSARRSATRDVDGDGRRGHRRDDRRVLRRRHAGSRCASALRRFDGVVDEVVLTVPSFRISPERVAENLEAADGGTARRGADDRPRSAAQAVQVRGVVEAAQRPAPARQAQQARQRAVLRVQERERVAVGDLPARLGDHTGVDDGRAASRRRRSRRRRCPSPGARARRRLSMFSALGMTSQRPASNSRTDSGSGRSACGSKPASRSPRCTSRRSGRRPARRPTRAASGAAVSAVRRSGVDEQAGEPRRRRAVSDGLGLRDVRCAERRIAVPVGELAESARGPPSRGAPGRSPSPRRTGERSLEVTRHRTALSLVGAVPGGLAKAPVLRPARTGSIVSDGSAHATDGALDTVLAVLDHAADARRRSPAVRCAGRDVGAASLRSDSLRIAATLAAWGIEPGDRVALMMGNVPEFLAVWFGILRAGAIEVPIHSAYRGPLLEHILRESGAGVLICDAEFARAARRARRCRRSSGSIVRGAGATPRPASV